MNDVENYRTLSVARKILSLRTTFHITDSNGQILYECSQGFAWFNPSWTLSHNGVQMAVFKRKVWSLAPTWEVKTNTAHFLLRGKLFSPRRRILIEGGDFDGAELVGNLFDMRFKLSFNEKTISEAKAKVLTMRERHEVILFDDSPQVELLTAILMSCLLIQKSVSENDNQAGSD